MGTRLLVILFSSLFVIGAFPVFLLQPFGASSAGVTAGFILPAGDIYHASAAIAIGLLSAWLGEDAILFLPLSTLLIMCIGSLMEINAHSFPAVHGFIIGAILLFALTVSMLRNRSWLFFILPIALWAYFSGGSFMHQVPSIATPLFFLIGVMLSLALLLAIGIALGVTLNDQMQESVQKLKSSPAFASFLSLF